MTSDRSKQFSSWFHVNIYCKNYYDRNEIAPEWSIVSVLCKHDANCNIRAGSTSSRSYVNGGLGAVYMSRASRSSLFNNIMFYLAWWQALTLFKAAISFNFSSPELSHHKSERIESARLAGLSWLIWTLRPRLHDTGRVWKRYEILTFRGCVHTMPVWNCVKP